jgi:hypothetical protein
MFRIASCSGNLNGCFFLSSVCRRLLLIADFLSMYLVYMSSIVVSIHFLELFFMKFITRSVSEAIPEGLAGGF